MAVLAALKNQYTYEYDEAWKISFAALSPTRTWDNPPIKVRGKKLGRIASGNDHHRQETRRKM